MAELFKYKIWHLISNRWNSAITEYSLSCTRSLLKETSLSVYSPMIGSPAQKRALKYGLDVRGFADFSLKSVIKFRILVFLTKKLNEKKF